MKLKQLAGIFLGLSVFLFASCRTPPPLPPPPPPPPVMPPPPPAPPPPIPLTVSFADRLRIADDTQRFQLHLFGRVTLEREHMRSTDNVERGRATIVNEHIRTVVIIPDQTPGQAIGLDNIGGEIRLFVTFDDGYDSVLEFSSRADNPEGFFYLRYDPTGSSGEDRGWLRFRYRDDNFRFRSRGDSYSVRYTGTGDRPPHLLIQLSHEERNQLNQRTFGGRTVN